MGGSNTWQFLVVLLLFVGVVALAFLVLRAFMLWYWKIDRIVALLEELVSVAGRASPAAGNQAAAQPGTASTAGDDGSPPRTLSKAEYKSLSLAQQVAVKDYGRLLSPDDAAKMGEMLGNFKDAEAKNFAMSRGERVTGVK